MAERPSAPDRREPLDQRVMLFLMLSMSILMLGQLWAPRPAPDQEAKKPAPRAARGLADDEAPDEPEAGEPEVGESGAGQEESEGEDANEEGPQPGDDDEAAAGGELDDAPAKWITLGSVDPESGWRMLVTLNSRGAGVERIELGGREFRDEDDLAGYLGHLAPTPIKGSAEGQSAGGLEVRVVGPGTPAHAAGLKPGDVLLGVQGKNGEVEFTDAASLDAWLATTKPGRQVTLRLRRGGQEETADVRLARRPLQVVRPESENLRMHREALPEGHADRASFLVRLAEVEGLGRRALARLNRRLTRAGWELVESDDTTVTFRTRLEDEGLEVEKRFTLAKESAEPGAEPAFHFDLRVAVKNLGDKPRDVAYRLEGPNGLPIEGYWYANKVGRTESGRGSWGVVGLRDVILRYHAGPVSQVSCANIAKGKVPAAVSGGSLAYVGVDAQYFASMVIPDRDSFAETLFDGAEATLATPALPPGERATLNNPTFVLTREVQTLAAAGTEGDSVQDGFRVFNGPKRPELLSQYAAAGDPAYSLSDVPYYGWFAPVAQLMLGILHGFYALARNYGVAIVLLTVLVRGAMFPISRKQAANMVKMQEIKPEMDRLNEKHKGDPQRRMQAQQELLRKHNVNPMGGCLPMLIQLPIFVGLYRALAVDVELRGASLFGDWTKFCSNLAAPDKFMDWSPLMPRFVEQGEGFFGLGPYFNLLPIATIGLFLLQQHLFMPPPANEQAEMQQKMMKYMMVFMGLMFFKVPSGLCLYFIASSLWGITERLMLPKAAPALGAAAGRGEAARPAGGRSAGGNGATPRPSSKGAKQGKKKR